MEQKLIDWFILIEKILFFKDKVDQTLVPIRDDESELDSNFWCTNNGESQIGLGWWCEDTLSTMWDSGICKIKSWFLVFFVNLIFWFSCSWLKDAFFLTLVNNGESQIGLNWEAPLLNVLINSWSDAVVPKCY